MIVRQATPANDFTQVEPPDLEICDESEKNAILRWPTQR